MDSNQEHSRYDFNDFTKSADNLCDEQTLDAAMEARFEARVAWGMFYSNLLLAGYSEETLHQIQSDMHDCSAIMSTIEPDDNGYLVHYTDAVNGYIKKLDVLCEDGLDPLNRMIQEEASLLEPQVA